MRDIELSNCTDLDGEGYVKSSRNRVALGSDQHLPMETSSWTIRSTHRSWAAMNSLINGSNESVPAMDALAACLRVRNRQSMAKLCGFSAQRCVLNARPSWFRKKFNNKDSSQREQIIVATFSGASRLERVLGSYARKENGGPKCYSECRRADRNQ